MWAVVITLPEKFVPKRRCKTGFLDGPATMYFESGVKESEAHYKAGMLDGKTVAYYESGAKKAEAEYKEGVLHGDSINWGYQRPDSKPVNIYTWRRSS